MGFTLISCLFPNGSTFCFHQDRVRFLTYELKDAKYLAFITEFVKNNPKMY